MPPLLERYRGRYTLERLKLLYSDLLESIDVSGEDLGQRRGIDSSTENYVHVHPLSVRWFERRRRRSSNTDGLEIAAALRFLAATRSPDKEGDNGGAAALRDDEQVCALAAARKIEKKVANLIREIGEVVVNGEKESKPPSIRRRLSEGDSLACDPCFEYFCEKNMLSLFVDIAKENPVDQSNVQSAQHGVVWSPLVKAQVLQTVALLITAGFRNSHALYYMLSQDSINELMSCMIPLCQWTDPALERIVPAFVDLLKNLGLLLAGNADKDLFPFFTRQESFPLLHAALEIGTSTYAQMDSFVHITCLSLIVNIMKIDNPAILTALPEMRRLVSHLCHLLLNRFHRLAEQATGSVVDGLRCNAVSGQLKALRDQIQVLNDVFACGIPGLNVRLCESLLRRVVLVLLKAIESPKERAFIDVGVPDLDVIPQRESQAQVALFFLAQLFQHINYMPIARMLAVALFHPKSTTAMLATYSKIANEEAEEDYVIVTALDSIAQGKLIKDYEVIDNPYRRAFLRTLRGDFGVWRFPVAACVLETVLCSDAMDLETLQVLEITPRACPHEPDKDHDGKEEKAAEDVASPGSYYKPTAVEESLVAFLTNGPLSLSSVSKQCLECAGSLSLSLFHKSTMSVAAANRPHSQIPDLSMTPIHKALILVKVAYCKQALESQKCLGVADMFLELAEAAICSRYKKVESSHRGVATTGQPARYACHLSQIGCAASLSSPENLVRSYRCPKFTDVEEARFNIEMSIYFRTLCKVVRNFLQDMELRSNPEEGNSRGDKGLHLVDVADSFALTFGGLRERPDVGMDLDLRGRMTFPCFLSSTPSSPSKTTAKATKEETILSEAATLVLVVDPTDIYVARIMGGTGGTRGKIVCRVAISSVVAAAADAEWLHIAVRHPDVGLSFRWIFLSQETWFCNLTNPGHASLFNNIWTGAETLFDVS